MTLIGTFSFIVVMLVVPEAPRWLLVNGKQEEAIDSFNYIASLNFSNYFISKQVTFVEYTLSQLSQQREQ